MKAELVAELRKLLAEAGPVVLTEECGTLKHYLNVNGEYLCSAQDFHPSDGHGVRAHEYLSLITAAVNALPALLDALDEAEARLFVKLYEDWSERTYAAGWMRLNPGTTNAFMSWAQEQIALPIEGDEAELVKQTRAWLARKEA